MKKILLFLFVSIFINVGSRAQFVSIPDDVFKTFLVNKYPGCFNAGGQLDTTCTAITTEDSLTFSSQLSNQNSYVALAYFDALTYLDLSNNNIEFAAQLPAHLPSTLLIFKANQVTHGVTNNEILSSILPAGVQHVEYSNSNWKDFTSTIWPVSLKYLDLSKNHIAGNFGTFPSGLDSLNISGQVNAGNFDSPLGTLPSLPATLKYLDCSENIIAGFPTLPATLIYFDCSHQHFMQGLSFSFPIPLLANLPVLPANLVTLKCYANQLTSLPTLPATLEYLHCGGQKFSVTLEGITWSFPGISTLPILPTGLKYLNCGANAMTSLPNPLPPSLEYLGFGANGISTMPALPNTLTGLELSGTPITYLPNPLPPSLNYLNCSSTTISCLPQLPATMGNSSVYITTLYNLEITSTNINCIPNYVSGIRIHSTAITPLCSSANNTHGCQINPIIAGNIFYDNNSNAVQDAGELPRANVRVQLNGGDYGFTDINGHYEMTAIIGVNTLTIDPPMFYNPVPASVTHTVSSPGTVVNDLIALQPNSIFDSVKITITPSTNPRVSAPISYYVQYENVGTTVVNPAIVINYNNTSLTYNNSTNGLVTQSGNTLNLLPGTLQPGQGGAFTSNFTVSLSAPIGSTIAAQATITAGTNTCTDSTADLIVAPFDPNDKQATPSLTPEQINSGTFINYLIRFQNVGTANALNVFITDTLSSMLQENTLEMIAASHPCKVTLSGNKLLFEFRNINLPYKLNNEPGSHGFVRFRVKPQTSLVLNTSVVNKASIYFDYNLPVVTSDAITLVALSPVPLSLLDFKGKIVPGSRALLQWKTANEYNVSRFEIEQSLNGTKFNAIATETAVGTGDNAYSISVSLPAGIVYYRLRMIDIDGRFSYSTIVRLSGDKTNTGILLLNNPVRNELKISLMDNTLANTKAFLINSQGMTVRSFSLINTLQSIDVSDLATGIYFIKTAYGSEKIMISK